MAKKATINMVAERAGVSRGTVDRVLNQRPHVKPELRERIVRAMRELGYAYAIIGWPTKSAVDFYKKCVNAILIGEKSSGVYKRMIEIDE